jgi:hypothetical protein
MSVPRTFMPLSGRADERVSVLDILILKQAKAEYAK